MSADARFGGKANALPRVSFSRQCVRLALEHVIIPEAKANIHMITMKLDENERSTQVRLMKVKDMVVQQGRREEAERTK